MTTEIELGQLSEVLDFKALAEPRMPDDVRTIVQNAGTGKALAASEAAWERWALRPRALVDVSSCDTSTTVLGREVEFPLLVAPFTCQSICCEEGELATARASRDAGTAMVLSMGATHPPEEIGPLADGFWMQLNWAHDKGLIEDVVARAAAAGAGAICLTIDLPVFPWWPNSMIEALGRLDLSSFVDQGGTRTIWDGFDGPDTTDRRGLREASRNVVTWDDLAWLRGLSSLPLVLKGVMTGEDARRAVEHGADAVLVSNHGGHALDQSLATADVLAEVVAAVDGRVEVFVDGGVRSAADVVRALALGARAVLVGRPVLWGLTVAGYDGASRVLELFREELEVLMAMVGARNLAEIDSSTIALREPSLRP